MTENDPSRHPLGGVLRRRRGPLLVALAATAVGTVVVAGTAGALPGQSSGATPGADPAAPRVDAATVDAAPLAADADTYVVREAPSTRYGTATKLAASSWTTWHSEAYLGFEVPAPPSGQHIARARLDLTVERRDHTPRSVTLSTVTGPWSESTTYGTKPTLGAAVGSAPVGTPAPATVSVDVSPAVAHAGRYSFALTDQTAQSVLSVYSREHGSDGPRLLVGYAPDGPAPTTPAPTSAPTSAPTPAPTPGGTLCGAAFTQEPGETYQQALTRADARYGGLDIARIYYGGLPAGWPGKLDLGQRPLTVSFKADPKEILAGRDDSGLRTWFATAPTTRDVYWSYYHEPEDDIARGAFTAADYRAAWQRIASLADAAGNPRLHATLILMGWSLDPRSGRTWTDYFPGAGTVDVLAWDNYNAGQRKNTYTPAATIFGAAVAVTRAAGLRFAVAETGSPLVAGDSGTGRAAWLRDMARYLTAQRAVFAEYFDLDWRSQGSVDFRLRDPASVAAWKEFCAG